MKKYKVEMQMTVDFETTVDAQNAKDAKEQAIKLRNKVVFDIDDSDITPAEYNGCSTYGSVWNCKATSMTTNEISTKRPLILLCGKSGSGKTTISNQLTAKYGLKQLESCTTRPPRKDGEVGHIFTNLGIFSKHVREGKVIAQADINGHKYWATKDQLDNTDIYVIDPRTALELEKKVEDERKVIIVYLTCPESTRIYRMAKRGDSLTDIQKRLVNEEGWDDYIATINYRRQRFDSGEYDAVWIAERIMSVYNYCLNGKWK